MSQTATLTDRQQREIEYHKEHAKLYEHRYNSLSWELVTEPDRRWWNQAWVMYTKLIGLDLRGKRVLVVGCGFGDDAFLIAKLGAEVYGFDLSQELLDVGAAVSARENLDIRFARMAAEKLDYPDGFFDCVLIRDILHHVEIPKTLKELVRVSKNGAAAVINEVYTHSFADRIRQSPIVADHLYRRMQRIVYGKNKPYITDDERKLDERDVRMIRNAVVVEQSCYFDLMINRVLPSRYPVVNKADYLLLNGLGPAAKYFAGRVLMVGRIAK